MNSERFPGFPDRMAYLPLPAPFFGSLLRDIDDLAELKLTLHCCRLLHQQKGNVRYERRSQLEHDRALLLALRPAGPDGPEQALARAIEAACARAVFLALAVETDAGEDWCYFLNTPRNRQFVGRVRAGEASLGPLRPMQRLSPPAPLPRPGIYELYEQNVGLLTPLIAEELREAELRYPSDWIEDAFREAVAYNKRSWRYVRSILDNWATRGRGRRGEDRRYPQPPEDPGKYFEGPYGQLLKR
jgi:DNA replication protein